MKVRTLLKAAVLLALAWPICASAQKGRDKTTVTNLYGVKIEPADSLVRCRTIPFLAAPSSRRENTVRVREGDSETIPVGSPAAKIYLLGLINDGWDNGLAHWGEHFELHETREDQVQIGTPLGEIEIRYTDGTSDRIPVVVGFTAWFFNQWKYASHEQKRVIREPFASRPEYMAVLRDALQLREEGAFMEAADNYRAYYLPVTPRDLPIESVVIRHDRATRGEVLVSGVTLELPRGVRPAANLVAFGKQTVARQDMEPAFATDRIPDYRPKLDALSDILYNSPADLPQRVERLEFPDGFRGARIRFLSDSVEGDMLSNIWTANLLNIDEKFDPATGCFYETGVGSPFYGGYQGIGTWEGIGVYREPYSRTSDHYVRQALRCIDNPERITSYVDYCDKWLYFYRSDRDPANGPDNGALDVARYPKDAPPHWAFVMNGPAAIPYPINEIPGDEEMEGHSSTVVARWFAWKLLGRPTGEWMTSARDSVYRKTRWQSTKDATDFICWLMDYTGRDVVWSEGEFTGWAAKFAKIPQIPAGMDTVTDPVRIRENYANSDMYEVYASYTSMTALLCSAEMADAMGERALAQRYRDYAARIRSGMLRLLAVGPDHDRMWKVARNSVLPSLQDCLVQSWFGLYREGLDPQRTDQELTAISRNTLRRQLDQRYGDAPVLGMGYGIGWLTHAALVQDRMDNGGRLLRSIARYTYDKNMDYADPARGIDWRRWLWIVPEGVNIMPDGRWYRICDLSNGANQGPVMNALEVCAGVDDSQDGRLRLLPRIADPMSGIEVSDFRVMTGETGKQADTHIAYTYRRGESFALKSDRPLPVLDIRFGPYTDQDTAGRIAQAVTAQGARARIERSGTYRDVPAIWVWAEDMRDVGSCRIEAEGL